MAAIVIAGQVEALGTFTGTDHDHRGPWAVLTESAMDGFDPNDRRCKEGITAEDVRKELAAIEDDADIPVVGELRRENSAFRIVCAFGSLPSDDALPSRTS